MFSRFRSTRERARIHLAIGALILAAGSAGHAQPGGGSPECWDIELSNLDIDPFTCTALYCEEPFQEMVPGSAFKTVNTFPVWLNCATCPGEWISGVCFIDLNNCNDDWTYRLHDYDVGYDTCDGGAEQ